MKILFKLCALTTLKLFKPLSHSFPSTTTAPALRLFYMQISSRHELALTIQLLIGREQTSSKVVEHERDTLCLIYRVYRAYLSQLAPCIINYAGNFFYKEYTFRMLKSNRFKREYQIQSEKINSKMLPVQKEINQFEPQNNVLIVLIQLHTYIFIYRMIHGTWFCWMKIRRQKLNGITWKICLSTRLFRKCNSEASKKYNCTF